MTNPSNLIPPITDKLGRNWVQPKASDILIDDTHAIMDSLSFAQLSNYSTTRPSGVYPGKMWKADEFWDQVDNSKWRLLWYGDAFMKDGKELCSIHQRLIIIQDWKKLFNVQDQPTTPPTQIDPGNF